MLLLFLLTLHVSDVNGEVCAEFSFESSQYKVTFVEVTTPAGHKTWNEIRGMCDENYELVSITSAEENNVILDMLEECTDGNYVIGLSREAGLERNIDSNWKWESGESASGLFWALGEPNSPIIDCAIAYMQTSDSEPNVWGDDKCTDKLGTWLGSQGYGYICEKLIITTAQPTTECHPPISAEPNNQGEKNSSEVATIPTNMLPVTGDNEGKKPSSGVATILTSVHVTGNEGKKPNSGVDILLIVATSSSVFVIIILIFLHRCRDRLCCKRRTESKPEYMMDKTMTSEVPTEPRVNGHTEVNYAYCSGSTKLSKGNSSIRTQHDIDQAEDADNNMNVEVASSDDSGLPDTVTEENPNYDSYVKDEMELIYTRIPNIEIEGEVDNPAYVALPFEPDYDSVEKMDNVPQCIEMQNDYATVQYDENKQEVDKHAKAEMKKRHGYEEVGPLMKTTKSEIAKNDASLNKINPIIPNDSQDNICSIDNEKIPCDDLYAKPDMSKKRKGQTSVSNTPPSKTETSLRRPAVVVIPTDNKDDQALSGGKRKDGYEQVDLENVIPETKNLLDKTTDTNKLNFSQINLKITVMENSDIDSLYAKPDMTKKRPQTSTRKIIDIECNCTQTNDSTNVSGSSAEMEIVSDSGTNKETVDDGNMTSSCKPEKV